MMLYNVNVNFAVHCLPAKQQPTHFMSLCETKIFSDRSSRHSQVHLSSYRRKFVLFSVFTSRQTEETKNKRLLPATATVICQF